MNQIYSDDISRIASAPYISWETLYGKTLIISGATGMIGSCLIDAIQEKNRKERFDCTTIALGRNEFKAKERFHEYWDSPFFRFIECDINHAASFPADLKGDFFLHLASNTHPVAYSTDPIGTITANIIGTKNMLDIAVRSHATRFLFASSNEVYGENRGDKELFDESYCGYIDCNTLRAGYPESKRCGESLCQAYMQQKGLDVVIARLTRSFGPTLLPTDTKALSQFLRNGANKEDIVLKSAGNQYYSYTYSADAVTGLLTVLTRGDKGEAYNVSDQSCDIKMKDLAQMIADISGTRVIFALPSEIEARGFSKATKARLDGNKLHSLGWSADYSIKDGLVRTLACLKG